MPDYANRLDAVAEDFMTAARRLRGVLEHIEATKPSPELRVLMQNNLIVALTAAIEEALRGLFSEYLHILEENVISYLLLRRALQDSNFRCLIEHLQRVHKDEGVQEAARIAEELDKCLKGAEGYKLQVEMITYNRSNFKSKQVTEISKAIGIAELWLRLCQVPEIEDYLYIDDVSTRVNELTSRWNELFDERDIVVHRMSQASGWGGQSIIEKIDMADKVVTALSNVLATDLSEILEV